MLPLGSPPQEAITEYKLCFHQYQVIILPVIGTKVFHPHRQSRH